MEDMLVAVDRKAWNLQVHNGHDGKLITSHRLESGPWDVCLISKNEVAVCLGYGPVVILSLKSIDDVKLVKTLQTGFDYCYSLVKWKSDKLIVSGMKRDGMLCWRILSIRDGRMDSTHYICEGDWTHMAVKDNTVYISCVTLSDFINKGIHVYDILNPKTKKFLYQHQELEEPGSIMADRDYVYVCDRNSNRIHQLTDSGQLVTIHTVSSRLWGIFYDDQQQLLYTTSYGSNVITVYKMESLHQPDPLLPVEILSMDDNSIQLFKKALHAGKEKVYNIRVMVVGQFGVGKTTLIKRLLGQRVDISERKSTEGIDVHKHCCKISLDKGEWIQQVEDSDQLHTLNRLIKLLPVPDQKPDISQEQESISQLIYQREITSEIDATKSNVPSTTSVSDQEVQSSTQVSITRGYEIHHVEHLDKETDILAVPLSDAKSSESEKTTKDAMMEILRLVNEKADKLVKDIEKYAALSFWDFAGQCVFYTTHQMFLTSRAIYLLVIDLSQQITDQIQNDKCFLDADGIKLRKVLDLLHIWMNSIHSCVPSSEAIIPVILVGTHVDKLSEKSLKQDDIEKYFFDLQCMLGEPTIRHLQGNIAIDNTQPGPMLEELKRRIFELSKQQPHWGEEKPARWLPLEQAIMTLKASGTKIVPLSLIEEINMSGSVKIEDRNELKLFLNFHHEMGTILYFSVKELREKIVLDPQWMIDALKSLITAENFVLKHPAITSKYRDFIKTGELTHELIDAIWTKEDNPEFHNHKDHILSLMEELNIIAKPRIFSEEGKETKEEPYFLAPCILQQKMPEEIISPKLNSQMEESSPVLCYVFTGNFLPSAIFHRLVAACIAHWEVAKKMKEHREENLIFCGCCVFKLKKNHQLTLHFRQHVIFLRVTRMGIKDKTPSSKLCIEVREFITTNLEKIIGYLGKGLKFEYSIQCPEYNGVSINSLIPLSRLKEEEEVCCEFDHMKDDHMINKHIIKSCKVLDFWFEDQEQTVMEGIEEGKESKVSENGEDASLDRVLSTSIKKGVSCSDPKLLCQLLQKSQQAVFSSQSTLEANCLSVGLVLHGETPANGNCFFEAVSSQLRRLNCVVQKSPQQLRQEVVEFMRANRVIQASEGTIHLDSFIYNESFDVYCMRMARDGEWADHVVVVAMARMLKIDIMIVTSSPLSGPEHIVWVVGQTSFQEDPILLGHIWESHYMSLQPIESTAANVIQTPTSGSTAANVIQTPTSGSTAANIIQTPTSGSTAANVIQTPTSGSTAANVIQTPTSGSTAANVIQTSTSGSTAANVIQTPTSGSTAANVIQTPTSGSTAANVIQTPTSGSTAANVIQTPTSGSTAANVIQTPTSGSTAVNVIQTPSSGSTAVNVIQTPTSGSTAANVIQTPTSESTAANVIQTPTSGSTAANVIQTPTSGSTAANVIQTPTSGSTAANVIQTPRSGSTAANVIQTPTSGSTAANVIQTPTSGSTAANVIQTPTSGPTAANVIQTPTSGSTAVNVIQTSTSGSTAANVIQTTISGSTAANVIQTPTSGSTAANIIQTSTSGPTAAHILQSTTSGSKSSTTAGLTPVLVPVLSSYYTACGLQPQASSSIQCTTANVTQAPSLDDTGRFVHIACLLVNVGAKVLRRLLLYHTVKPTRTLDQYLAKNRIDIDNLRQRKILNKSQMDILFPPGGSTNLGDYDITLLSALFTNIVLKKSHQDLNKIQFLRDKRNEIFAHAKSLMVNSNNYQTFWNDIRGTLEALSKQCNDPDFENEMSREIQAIQVSTVQGTSLPDALQTHRKIETLEKLLQYVISSHAQELNKESDDSGS